MNFKRMIRSIPTSLEPWVAAPRTATGYLLVTQDTLVSNNSMGCGSFSFFFFLVWKLRIWLGEDEKNMVVDSNYRPRAHEYLETQFNMKKEPQRLAQQFHVHLRGHREDERWATLILDGWQVAHGWPRHRDITLSLVRAKARAEVVGFNVSRSHSRSKIESWSCPSDLIRSAGLALHEKALSCSTTILLHPWLILAGDDQWLKIVLRIRVANKTSVTTAPAG